jgi:hypothetical protein
LKEQCVYLAKKLGCIDEMLAINHGIWYKAETVDDWVMELKKMATEKGMFEFLNADKKTKWVLTKEETILLQELMEVYYGSVIHSIFVTRFLKKKAALVNDEKQGMPR